MKVLLNILFLFAVLLLASCYKPSKEYYQDIETNLKPPVISVSNSFGSDTVVMTSGSSLEVNVFSEDLRRFHLRLLMNGVQKYLGPGPQGRFIINDRDLGLEETGYYPMEMEIYVSTNSGSIADGVGAENFVTRKNMILVYLKDVQWFSPGFAMVNANGALQGTLTIPQDVNNITRVSFAKERGTLSQLIDIVDGSQSFQFVDEDYVGEYYNLKCKIYIGDDDHQFYYPFKEISYEKESEFTAPEVHPDGNGWPVLTWNKCPYSQGFGMYRIRLVKNFNKQIIKEINNIDQNSYTGFDPGFPEYVTLYMTYLPKNPPPGFTEDTELNVFSKAVSYTPGVPSFTYDNFFAPLGNDIWTTYNYVLHRYNSSDFSETEKINLETSSFPILSVSPNNKFLLCKNGSSYLVYNIVSGKKDSYPCSQITGNGFVSALSISDNGIGAIEDGDKLYIYDFVNHHLIFSQSGIDIDGITISPQGTELLVRFNTFYYLYHIGDTSATLTWSAGSTINFATFFPDDSRMLSTTYSACIIRDSHNGNIISSFSVGSSVHFALPDFNSGKLLVECIGTDNKIRLYDISTGSLYREIRDNTLYGTFYLRLSGNTVFYSESNKGSRITL